MKSLFVCICLGGSLLGSAQQFKSPSEGKALVYFVRTHGTGAMVNFKYFDGDKFLGKFNNYNFAIYECEPGEHVFWVTSENRDFLEAGLLPNKTYVIQVMPRAGAVKAAVKIFAVAPNDTKRMEKVNKVFAKRSAPIVFDGVDDDDAQDLAFYIKNGMEKYAKDKENGESFSKILKEMYHNK